MNREKILKWTLMGGLVISSLITGVLVIKNGNDIKNLQEDIINVGNVLHQNELIQIKN